MVEVHDIIPKISEAQVDIQVRVSAQLNVTAFVARQKVGGVLLSQVGTGVIAGDPTLIATSERLLWRVPVFLALPGMGRLGELGQIAVDAQSGELLADHALLDQLVAHAQHLDPTATP